VGRIDLWPYGEIASRPDDLNETHLFTGHEREYLGDNADALSYLDYMHARYYSSEIARFLTVDEVMGRVGFSQSWNLFSYVEGRSVASIDPDGREYRIGNARKEVALEAERLSVEPSARDAIFLETRSEGGREYTVISVDNSCKSKDANFENLQKVANSPGIVELNEADSVGGVTIEIGPGGGISGEVGSQRTVGFTKGVTLPSKGTSTGNEDAYSTRAGITQVFVDQNLTAEELAPVVAAEIAGHALPALLGQGAQPADRDEHVDREMPAQDLARVNRELPK
jgi:RHS repeat-associated protein